MSLPPPPTNDATGSYAWLEWFRQLRNYITQVGSVPWSIIDFGGSTLSSIASRSHQVLQSLQGGTSGEYYHLTNSDYSRYKTIESVTPTAGTTITISDTTRYYVMTPAGTLATLTVKMPANPVDGQEVWITSTQILTALTHQANTGQTLRAALTTLAVDGRGGWVYKLSNTTWYRIG